MKERYSGISVVRQEKIGHYMVVKKCGIAEKVVNDLIPRSAGY